MTLHSNVQTQAIHHPFQLNGRKMWDNRQRMAHEI